MSYVSQINPFRKDPERERLKSLLPSIGKESLIAEVSQAILSQNQGQIDLLCKEMPFEPLKKFTTHNNPLEAVKNEALFLPPPPSDKILTTSSWLPKPGFFGKTVQYVTETVWQSYGIDLDAPPKNTWTAQGQLNIFRSIITDSQWIVESALVYFVTVQKTILAAAGVLLCLFGIRKIYSYFQLGIPEVLDKNQITNLTRKAQDQGLKKAIGRTDETQSLITALTPSAIEKPKIAFLVGKPGVGKTQLVESLAMQINEGTAPTLQGKKLFSVNTASLTEIGSYNEHGYSSRLDLVFKAIAGYENDVILFFDEAHNAATTKLEGTNSNAGNGLMLELLKTKLLEKNISAILATTEEEYDKFIAPNKAFVERTEKIYMSSLKDEQTKLILKETIQNEQIDTSQNAIDTILEIGSKNDAFKERANPRKSFDILQKGTRHVLAWQPSSLRKQFEKEEIELRMLKADCSKANGEKELLFKLKEKKQRIESLTLKLKTQKVALDSIRAIGSMEKRSFKHYCQVVHQLNDSISSENLQRDYLFFKEILLPSIQQIFSKKVAEFESEYGEKIPLQIDAALLKSLYPTS